MNKNMLLRFLPIVFLSVSCAIDIDVTDYSRASSTLNFENPDDFNFDPNYVEVKNNQLSLKPIDLEHSGDDFSKGSHVGSSVTNSKLALMAQPPGGSNNINSILPGKSSSLAGYWSFDGSLADATANSTDGTLQSGALHSENAKLGSGSVLFDGLASSVGFGDAEVLDLGTEDITVSAWILRENSAEAGIVVANGANSTGDAGYWLHINHTTGRLHAWVSDGTSYVVNNFAGTTNLMDDQWHHIVWVWDRDVGNRFYIDGRLESTDSTTNTSNIGSFNDFHVGGHAVAAAGNYKGNIDELSIWKTALDAEEVLDLYNGQNASFTELSSSWTPHFENLVGYWKMDGNWQDSSGNQQHGTSVNSPSFTPGTVGPFGGLLDGISDYITIPHDPIQSMKNVSIVAWINRQGPSGNGHTYSSILTKGNNSGAGIEKNYSLEIQQPLNKLRVRFGDGSISQFCDSNTSINDNQWYHVASTLHVVGGNTSVEIFIDGALDNICIIAGASPDDTLSGEMTIGAWRTGSTFGHFNGQIDDVGLFSINLTNSDISQIYNRQKQKYASHFDSEILDMGSTSSSWLDLSWSTSMPFGKELVGDYDSDGIPDGESSSDYSGLSGDLSDGLIGYWPLDNSVNDLSGNENNGSNVGANFLKDSYFGGYAANFDGSNYIELNSASDNLGASWSVSGWVKTTTEYLGTSQAALFGVHGSSGTNKLIILIGDVLGGSGSDNEITVYDGNDSSYEISSDVVVVDGSWHQFVYTSSGSLGSLYVDGKLTGTHTPDYSLSPTNLLSLGQEWDGGSESDYFTGQIDEVAIWSKVLTATEIQQLYRRGANRIKIQVKSCVDSSCNCKSFSTAPVGSVNDCDGDGIVNAEDSDDIHQAEFMGPGGDGTTFFSELMNRRPEDVTFDCDANTSDSDDNICVDDEILLAGSPKPTSPLFSFDDYLGSVKPRPNRYFQYRVNMEADDNTACDGEPCLPELTSVNLNPSGEPRFYGQTQVVTSKKGIYFDELQRISIENAGTCSGFQLSPDGETFYYYDGQGWVAASGETQTNSADVLGLQITSFSQKFAPGNLFFKTFLRSEDTGAACSIGKINLDYRDETNL